MKILLAGGTGLIGRAFTRYITQKGAEVTILTREPGVTVSGPQVSYVTWHPDKRWDKADVAALYATSLQAIGPFDAAVNLAGASINTRWTAANRRQILDSRLAATRFMVELLTVSSPKPPVLINASAVGRYGTSQTKTFTEKSDPAGDDFLARVTQRWEAQALEAEKQGTRVVLARFGVVLDDSAGALPRMLTPFRLFAGGRIGTGTQWVSWVHVEDAVRLIAHSIQDPAVRGPLNVTAPNPIQISNMTREIGRILDRPHWLPVPAFALKALLGDMSMLVLEGQRVLPEKALELGFEFRYPQLRGALEELLNPLRDHGI